MPDFSELDPDTRCFALVGRFLQAWMPQGSKVRIRVAPPGQKLEAMAWIAVDAVATWPRTVDVIKHMKSLSAADKEKILGGNAMKMFGLNGNGAH